MTKRKFEIMARWPGICRILVWCESKKAWQEPDHGKRFKVTRYVKTASGASVREARYFKTFEEAKAFKGSTAALPEPVASSTPAGAMTLADVFAAWKANWLPNRDESTQIRYLSYLQHFEYLKDMKVEEIRAKDIDGWIAHVKRPEYLARFHSTRCGYGHEFTVLKGILNYYASRFNRNYSLPFLREHVADLKVRESKKVTKDLTMEQMQGFISALRAEVWGTKFEGIYYIAMMQYLIYGRVQEAAALQFESFDFAQNRINVNHKVLWMRKKGMKDKIVDGSKSNGGKVIDMSAHAARLFREWTLKTGVRTGPLFLLDGEIISFRMIQYRYSQALKKAGLPFRGTHILRHAALTEYYEGCKDLLATARMAGHSDLASTERYTKNRSEALTKNQRQMDEKLSGLFATASS